MSVNYTEKSKFLKRKLKYLVYEHESLKAELEKSQRKLLKVSRDNSFLLDRLLQYEQVIVDSPIDSDATLSSDSDSEVLQHQKRKSTASSQSTSSKHIKTELTEKPDEKVGEETESQSEDTKEMASNITQDDENPENSQPEIETLMEPKTEKFDGID